MLQNPLIMEILREPNPRLHQLSEDVEVVDDEIVSIMDNMLATMYYAKGIGLAAAQVGILKKIIVIDIDKSKMDEGDGDNSNVEKLEYLHDGKPLFMINAKIINTSLEYSSYEEGCLSVPRVYADVIRPSKIKVKYLDYFGENKELEVGNNLLSVCIQHEIDHTNGIVFIDHLSKMKREFILKKMIKINDM